MKYILCYGDSNTFGYNPTAQSVAARRFTRHQRWPALLGRKLGAGVRVLEQGLGGRTTALDDLAEPGRNGLAWLVPCLQSQQPLDMVVFMLGTNDTKPAFNQTPQAIAANMQRLVQAAQNPAVYYRGTAPRILLISPPLVEERVCRTPAADEFDASSTACSRALAPLYRALARQCGCLFLNAAKVVRPSAADCVHLDAPGHAKLAQAVYEVVRPAL